MVHEHPGVYSSYDASSVIGGKKTARILGAAAVSTTGTANEVVTLTSYAEGVSAFGEDAEGTGRHGGAARGALPQRRGGGQGGEGVRGDADRL